MLVVVACALLTYFMFKGMGLVYVKPEYTYGVVFTYVFFYALFFWMFRTYSGIVRHSSIIDAIKFFLATFCTTTFLAIINFVNYFIMHEKIFLNTGLFINFFLSFSALFVYRIIIKKTFDSYINLTNTKKLIPAIILGSDANAISVAKALITETPSRFKIVGFIDQYNQNTSKRILDVPIVELKKRPSVMMRHMKAEALIIADKKLSNDERMAIVDDCLDFNYKVYTVPLISDWEDNKEISKKIKNLQIQDLLERDPIVLDNKAISSQLHKKVVLVTGAAGSIGSEIVHQVLSFEPELLIILDQAETPLHNLGLKLCKLGSKVKVVNLIADIRNFDLMETIFAKYQPEVVFHAAAYKHVPLMECNPEQAIFVNVMGTKNLTDLACKYYVDTFVMVSTDKAVNPSNVMGASKRIAEKYVQELHYQIVNKQLCATTKFITTRFGNVLGSNGSVVPLFTEQIANGGPVTITHPDIIRYFMTIPEACQLVLEAGAMGKGGEIYIFDMGKPVKIIDLAKKMIRLAGLIPDKDIEIKAIGLRPGEKLYEELLNDFSKTLPTYHEKIMISQESYFESEHAVDKIIALIEIAHKGERFEIVKQMKRIVPEFKSLNSEYEVLDLQTESNTY